MPLSWLIVNNKKTGAFQLLHALRAVKIYIWFSLLYIALHKISLKSHNKHESYVKKKTKECYLSFLSVLHSYRVFYARGRSTSAHLSAICCCCCAICASIKFRLLFIAQTWNLKLTNKLQREQQNEDINKSLNRTQKVAKTSQNKQLKVAKEQQQ